MTRRESERLHAALRYLTNAMEHAPQDATGTSLLVAKQHAVACGATPAMLQHAMRQAQYHPPTDP